MKNINEYDQRQLKLMYGSVISFEKKLIRLGSLVGTLYFLLSVLESVDEEWQTKFSNVVGDLETIFAIANIKESGGDPGSEMDEAESESIISNSISCIKKLIEEKLGELNEED